MAVPEAPSMNAIAAAVWLLFIADGLSEIKKADTRKGVSPLMLEDWLRFTAARTR